MDVDKECLDDIDFLVRQAAQQGLQDFIATQVRFIQSALLGRFPRQSTYIDKVLEGELIKEFLNSLNEITKDDFAVKHEEAWHQWIHAKP